MSLKVLDDLDLVLKQAAEAGASDVHLETGAPPKYRLYGKLTEMQYAVLRGTDLEYLFRNMLDAYARKVLKSEGQWDTSYNVKNVGRFRVNIFNQKGALAGVFRYLKDRVPEFTELGLPMTVFNLTTRRRGLVLITGPTGSGKTTTLASLIDIINKNYYKHIITLEDPIEYLHWHARCNVSQREIGTDVISFDSGLRAALREDPDIIVVGEMRDMETMTTALLAAETGHLVCSTLHTIGAAETVNRVLDTFPERQHNQVRSQLVSTLEAVVSQQLLPRKDGKGYVCAYEIMTRNRKVQHFINEDDYEGLVNYMASEEAKHDGMCTMDETIISLYSKGFITRDVALDYAMNRKSMDKEISNIRVK